MTVKSVSVSPLLCTYATRPTNPIPGQIVCVTDCNTQVWGANCAGSGTYKVLAWFSPAANNWTVFAK